MKKWFFLLCFYLVLFNGLGQELPVNISYFGESALHPGFRIGTELTLLEKEKIKSRWLFNRQDKIGSKVKTKQLLLNGNVGFYNHPNNHSGILISSDLIFRRTKNRKGFFLEAGLGVGFLQKIYNIETYELGNGNNPEFIGTTGYGQFLVSLPMGFGKGFSYKSNLPISCFLKVIPWLGFFQGHTIVPNAALEIGVRYNFNTGKK